MNKFLGKAILGMSVAALLVGCGGGGSDKDKDGPSIPTVEGVFKYTNQNDGVAYQAGITGSNDALACEHASGYFESDNVMVYSGGTHSNSELQRVASVAEYAMQRVIPHFGFQSMAELNAQKRVVAYNGIGLFASDVSGLTRDDGSMIGLNELSSYFEGTYPVEYTGWTDPSLTPQVIGEEFYNQLLVESDPDKVLEVLSEVAVAVGVETGYPGSQKLYDQYIADNTIHSKMQICALNASNNVSGEGVLNGFIIPSNMDAEIYIHEGTHYVQQQYAPKGPRWLTEGQAVVVAGQRIASTKPSWTLIKVLEWADEEGMGATNGYEHYGLAYSALKKHNSMEAIVAFMQGYSMNLGSEIDYSSENFNFDKTTAAFESVIVGRDGADITYQEFENTYAQLAK